jgi:hypothetical protein
LQVGWLVNSENRLLEQFDVAGGAELEDRTEWEKRLKDNPPAFLVDLDEMIRVVVRRIEDRQAAATRKRMQAEERTARLRSNISLEEWKRLEEAERSALLDISVIGSEAHFNRQENADIEWAQRSLKAARGA